MVPQGDSKREVRAIGQASILRQFTPRWKGSAEYSRGVHYLEGLGSPVSYDQSSVTLSGQLARKWAASLGAAYVRGRVYLLPNDHPYNLFSGSARLSYSQSDWLTTYAMYQLYGYDFSEGALLPRGVPTLLKRNAIQIGMIVGPRVIIRHR
jgi:hypothetical protein